MAYQLLSSCFGVEMCIRSLLYYDDSFYAANGISTDDIVSLGLVYQF
ncbi:outer membrane pore protein [Escherichia coli]|nr:outer membrane pore protein [Escherichia coli]